MIKEYLLSILGLALLSVIVHLVLPENKTSKIVLSCFSIFSLIVVLGPVLSWGKNIDLSALSYDLDEEFLSSVSQDEESSALKTIVEQSFPGARVSVVKNGKLSYIFVDLHNLVLNESKEHINYYQAVKEIIKDEFEIADERIVVYG